MPMFIALRRFTLVCTILLERLLMGKQHEKATLGAVAVMVGGVPWLACFLMTRLVILCLSIFEQPPPSSIKLCMH